MTINKTLENGVLNVQLEGRLDTTTAPELETSLSDLSGVELLTFDFAELQYISSAGLRVLLSTHKVMSKQGKMIIKNVNDTIMEVFEITGFAEVLNVE